MELIDILGWIACIITIIYTSFGLPTQIIKNFKMRSTKGLSLFLFVFLFLTFTSWVIYGLIRPDYFIVIPNAIGAIFTFILIYQIIYYQKKFTKQE